MQTINYRMLKSVLAIATQAGQAILEIYKASEEVEIELKSDDSPVTAADHAAHRVIVNALTAQYPSIPVFSEESGGIAFEDRKAWPEFWLVDPLDGTKEFINRTGEFTVNIALIQNGEPVLGVVSVPLKGQAFVGAQGMGAYKVQIGHPWLPIKTRDMAKERLVVVGSRRHGAQALDALLEKLGQHFESIESTNMGSSLKFCLIAEGKADIYPRLALTSEWDTAAAQAVLMAAGGVVLDVDFNPLRYNKGESVLNPFFYAFGDTNADWSELLVTETA
ncbi:MAG: 3'(2'),5'-bisphosphate nucleotidase [Gammaproteobacteria bacterium]|nr:MAG: 3'(2'),5'-bisphosphate nucleotidase [Gammaproteobacteria bacterium]